MNRRNFFKGVLGGAAALVVPLPTIKPPDIYCPKDGEVVFINCTIQPGLKMQINGKIRLINNDFTGGKANGMGRNKGKACASSRSGK